MLGHQSGIKGELQRMVRLSGALALVRGLEVRKLVIYGKHVDGPLERQIHTHLQGEPFLH